MRAVDLPLFVYGTLREPEIFRMVAGVDARRLSFVPARLSGHRVARARGLPYPVLVPAAGGVAEGLLVRGLPACAWARIDAYEDDAVYLRGPVRVRAGGRQIRAWTYLGRIALAAPARWRIEHWRALDGKRAARALREVETSRPHA